MKKDGRPPSCCRFEDYEKLQEDLEDLAVIAERRDEETIPHTEFKKELKRNGLSH